MRILLVASAYNSLTQRVHAELSERRHAVVVEVTPHGEDVRRLVHRHDPDLVVAPLLKAVVPPDVWAARTCLIAHPGPVGDRGPSSLDWAVQEGACEWGVTVLEAVAEMDAGPVWATTNCAVPEVAKSDLYRGEVSDAALEAVLLAVDRFASGTYVPAAGRLPQPAGCQDPIAGAAEGPGHLLGDGLHRHRPAQAACRGLPAGRARRTSRPRMVPVRRPRGGPTPRPPG
ncbi:hypothetical protein WJ438_04875 [Streptomyces sp. GD-15H]